MQRGPAATAILLDASLSMRYRDGETLFERGRAEVRAAIAQLSPGDPVTLLLCGGPSEARRAPVTVLWCADTEADLYCRTELAMMAGDGVRIECVADPRRDAANAGLRRATELARAAAASTGARCWILLGGSPGFVHAAADALADAGIDPHLLHSDVFAYAPRAARQP